RAVARHENAIPLPTEDGRGHFPHLLLIIDDKNQFTATMRQRSWRLVGSYRYPAFGCRQVNSETGTGTNDGFHFHESLVSFDNSAHRGQPKPGPVAGIFRGEKRLPN